MIRYLRKATPRVGEVLDVGDDCTTMILGGPVPHDFWGHVYPVVTFQPEETCFHDFAEKAARSYYVVRDCAAEVADALFGWIGDEQEAATER